MDIKNRLTEDMKTAMRAKDKQRLGTIRMALAEIKRVEVDTREAVDDGKALAILQKMVKQRQESIKQYQAGGRDDLAAVEQTECEILSEYLPQPLSEEALKTLIQSTIQATGATTMADMGKLMAELKPKLAGQADMGQVSQLVKAALTS